MNNILFTMLTKFQIYLESFFLQYIIIIIIICLYYMYIHIICIYAYNIKIYGH